MSQPESVGHATALHCTGRLPLSHCLAGCSLLFSLCVHLISYTPPHHLTPTRPTDEPNRIESIHRAAIAANPSVCMSSAASSSGSGGSELATAPVTAAAGSATSAMDAAAATAAAATAAAGSAASAAAPSNTAGVAAAPATSAAASSSSVGDKKEIYTYEAPWLIYGMNWSVRPDQRFRVALGSFVEDYNNKVEVVQLDEESGKFQSRGSFVHPYPTTKIMWCPDKTGAREDLLATTGDYLRIWRMPPDNSSDPIKLISLLNNVSGRQRREPGEWKAQGWMGPVARGHSTDVDLCCCCCVGLVSLCRTRTGETQQQQHLVFSCAAVFALLLFPC